MKNCWKTILIIVVMLGFSGCCLRHEFDPATCTTPSICVKCGKTADEKLGHDWSDATCLLPKTCLTCEITDGEPMWHSWVEATCANPKVCSVCNITEGEPLEHAWNEATCINPKTCSMCGSTDGELLEHTYSSQVSVEATCETSGVMTYTCNVCGKSYVEDIAPKNHSYSYTVTKKATCDEKGIMTYTCNKCSSSYTELIEVIEHEYTSQVTQKATCDKNGVRTYTCGKCKKIYTETIKATKHEANEHGYCENCDKFVGTYKQALYAFVVNVESYYNLCTEYSINILLSGMSNLFVTVGDLPYINTYISYTRDTLDAVEDSYDLVRNHKDKDTYIYEKVVKAYNDILARQDLIETYSKSEYACYYGERFMQDVDTDINFVTEIVVSMNKLEEPVTMYATMSLNVRSGPSNEYDKIGTIEEGTAISIIGQADNGWYKILINGSEGYVSNICVSDKKPIN